MNIGLVQLAVIGGSVTLVLGLAAIPIAAFRGNLRRASHLSLGCLVLLATLVVVSTLVWTATSSTLPGS